MTAAGRPNLAPYLGKQVTVEVDRPMGSTHPRHPDIMYPLNYGFIPGTRSGDGLPIDAYLMGVDEPVRRAKGVVIAIVIREDDIEDKLVVSTDAHVLSQEQIWSAIEFQERYFRSRLVIMNGTHM